MILANPAPVVQAQKEAAVATFQSPASVSPNVSFSNTKTLSPDCVLASNGIVVRRQDLDAFEQALKTRTASAQVVNASTTVLATTAISKDVDKLQNIPTLSDPDDSDAYTDLESLSEPELDPLVEALSVHTPTYIEPL
ncbi:Hypothetical predicted protein [Pelobates cultripes]|uniref:Uncharacterized protein n=1 Tax=Pelobates cultripes TaxID=61616 RepID=A0AAD1WHR3_PELCU|nr:Hypothetical predicted protein [Pelobates cultripes]